MKKELVMILFSVFLINLVSATCDLNVSLLNQDPYPAVPGDYVDLVFQVGGVENTDCGLITFELLGKYPIKLDPGQNTKQIIRGGTYTKDHSPIFMAPYTVRIDKDALDGNNTIEVGYTDSGSAPNTFQTKQFNLNVKDVKANFEMFVKNYDPIKKVVTFQILNIAKNDIEALTVEIPKQENIVIKGANKNIVGDLDSNDDTTAEFEATLKGGEINVLLHYTDAINERRTIEQTVQFDPTYFEGRKGEEKSTPWVVYIILVVVIGFFGWKYYKKKKKKQS